MRRIIPIFAVLMGMAFSFASQGQGGLNFTIAVPRGAFRSSVERNGYGINGHIAFMPTPYLAIGGAMTVLSYGSECREELFSTTIPDVHVEVTRSNNIAIGHIIMQLRATTKYVKPYIEGRFGFNYLWTETSIDGLADGETIASSTNFDDYALSYGGGGGIMLEIWKRRGAKTNKNKLDRAYIDIKTIFARGGEAEYLKEGSIIINDDASVSYLVWRSETDLLTIHIGFAVDF